MRVLIPSPLHSYTDGRRWVTANGNTLSELLLDLDAGFPGIRHRLIDEQGNVRPHMTIYAHGKRAHDLATDVRDCDEVVIMQALSGG
ncbi:MAG: MoaD/ThiS family protein [Pseudomonadales bacterium]|nr:MoaD/ThiS family protein [Pseudomonadales bacterium]MCP5184593.1 MoaD/ThiS family protein [Pseudomonadales bacterium]